MSWTQSPSFSLLLVFLILGNLGSNIFANANAIDCNLSWRRASPSDLCQVHNKDDTYTNWRCSGCHRADKGVPSGYDCAGPSGRPLDTTGSFNCDVGMDEVDDVKWPQRPIRCSHTDTDGVVRDYHCKTRHLNQQCPKSACHLAWCYLSWKKLAINSYPHDFCSHIIWIHLMIKGDGTGWSWWTLWLGFWKALIMWSL